MGAVSIAVSGAEARGAVGSTATHAWRAPGPGLRADGQPGRTGSAGGGFAEPTGLLGYGNMRVGQEPAAGKAHGVPAYPASD